MFTMASKKKKKSGSKAKSSAPTSEKQQSSRRPRTLSENVNVPTVVRGGVASPDRAAQYAGGAR